MERKTTEPIGMKIRQARLPVGIDQFEKLREGGYYYVDKTELIEQVIEEGCEVTLFTRPRRFGKARGTFQSGCRLGCPSRTPGSLH